MILIVTMVLVFIVQCIDSVIVNVKLVKAERSSNYSYNDEYRADRAIDNNTSSYTITELEFKPWLKISFDKTYTVKQVIIKGSTYNFFATYQVSIYNGEKETSCGNYTGYTKSYSHTQQCGNILGDSVMLKVVSEEETYLQVYEIMVVGVRFVLELETQGVVFTNSTAVKKGLICALKNPHNWDSHKVILKLVDDAGKAYTCTKDIQSTTTTCESTLDTDSALNTDEDMEDLNISASYTGSGNKVYTCSVTVDDVEDTKLIYAEKIVTSTYITHSDNKNYFHVNENLQYATISITTAHCGVYNNNANPDVTVTMSVANKMQTSKSHEFVSSDGLGKKTILCEYKFESANVTLESSRDIFLVKICGDGEVINSDGGCSKCVDGYRPSDQSQFQPCVPCGDGEGPNSHKSVCVACPMGQYSVHGKKCEKCPDGTKPDHANTTCEPCIIGYAGTGGSCEICKSGKTTGGIATPIYQYAAIQGQTECTLCEHEVVCDKSIDACTGCKTCDIGHHVEKGKCVPNECELGSVKDTTSGKCVPCMPGKYESKGKCEECDAGNYQDQAGKTACKTCYDVENRIEDAMYQHETGKSYCYGIKPGYALDDGNQALPEKICPAGSYSRGGAAVCTKCDASNKEYSPQEGAAFCSKCVIGKVIDDGTNCGGVYCPANEYPSKQVTVEETSYFFEKTSANSLNNKQVQCETSDAVEYITRYCSYNEEDSSGRWMDPDFGQCSSANSAALKDMIDMDLEDISAVAVNTKEMEKMATNITTLLPSDITLMATSLTKIGGLPVEQIDIELAESVTGTIDKLAVSGDKLKSVSPEKKADMVATVKSMADATTVPEGIQQETVAIKKVMTDPSTKDDIIDLTIPRVMDKDEKPGLDLAGVVDLVNQNVSVAVFDASAKGLFPDPVPENDPTGLNSVKLKELGSCIVDLTVKVEPGSTFKLSMSSKNKKGLTDAEVYGGNMLVQRQCHYLDTDDYLWKTDGCTTSLVEGTMFYQCECNHATSFAILLSISEIKDTLQDDVSTVLQSINIIFLLLTFFCLAPFKKFRTRRLIQIQIQLIVSLILANLSFMILSAASTVKVNENMRPLISLNTGCAVGIVIVEYLYLAVMAWMACAAVTLYGKIVEALKTYGKIDRFYFTKCMIGCWGIPIVLPLASFVTSYVMNDKEYNATTNDIYQTPFIMSTGKNGTACWVATPWKEISFFLPCWTCLVLNIVLLCMISRVIIRSGRTGSSSAGHAREVKALMTIGITVGVPWVFAALTVGPVAQTFQWLFIILANLQGPIMFICFVIFQEEVLSNIFGLIGKTPPDILLTSSKARSAREISSMAKAKTSVTQVDQDEQAMIEKNDDEVAEYAAPDENLYTNKDEAPKPVPDKVHVQPAACAAEEPEYSNPILETTSFPYQDNETDSQLDMPPPPPGHEEEIYENKAGEPDDVDFVQSSYPHIPQLV